MNELQLVTFEQAERLKKLGFNWGVNYHYNLGVEYPFSNKVGENYNDNDGDLYYSAPTVALALKWVRDVKGIFSCVDFAIADFRKGYYHNYFSFENKNYMCNKKQSLFGSYEDAESALLDELLNILKK